MRRRPAKGWVVTGVAAVLCACDPGPNAPPLQPEHLDASRAQALDALNQSGATSFAGWSWRYELGVDCVLRVHRQFEGRPQPIVDHAIVGVRLEVIPYATDGFGVKGYAADGSGSIDLFDAKDQARAQAFADRARALVAPCAASASKPDRPASDLRP